MFLSNQKNDFKKYIKNLYETSYYAFIFVNTYSPVAHRLMIGHYLTLVNEVQQKPKQER